ncbi:MAG TPA: hypothetical protein VK518_02030 [Puia sp.]|nr:hypothetical protein [Puia sp.]
MKIDKLDVGIYKTRAEMGAGRFIYGVVPGPLKAEAVYHTLRGKVAEKCPASIIREHAHAELFLDADSAKLVE